LQFTLKVEKKILSDSTEKKYFFNFLAINVDEPDPYSRYNLEFFNLLKKKLFAILDPKSTLE
jgi:hypothetical protein